MHAAVREAIKPPRVAMYQLVLGVQALYGRLDTPNHRRVASQLRDDVVQVSAGGNLRDQHRAIVGNISWRRHHENSNALCSPR